MTATEIRQLCQARYDELLKANFGDFAADAAKKKDELLDKRFNDNLPGVIAEEFKSYLEGLWVAYAPEGAEPFDKIMSLERALKVTDEEYSDYLKSAKESAEKVSLLERVTHSNHEDVTYYKGLLKQYAEELMRILMQDFMIDIEKVLPDKEEYIPQPVDVGDVVVPEELITLQEAIAENIHEVWSAGRMKEGWTYGVERNDKLKKHPDLVPYSNLSDTEKQYDRETAMNTIKLVIKLGYDFVKQPWKASPSTKPDETL